MNLLAYVVPAIREVRAPLVAGYLWLLVAWMNFADRVPKHDAIPTGSPWAQLARLQDVLGDAGTVVAASIAAYLLGSLITELVTAALDFFVLDIPPSEIEFMAEEVPEVKYLADSALRTYSESELRIGVALPSVALAITIASDSIPAAIAILFGSVVLALHGRWLLRRYGRGALRTMDNISRRTAALSEAERQAQRADLGLSVGSEPGGDRVLQITNNGGVRAMRIDIRGEDGKPIGMIPGGFLPVEELRPADVVRIPLAITMGDPMSLPVEMTWVDELGPGRMSQVLRLH